jgi:hypothetical protein
MERLHYEGYPFDNGYFKNWREFLDWWSGAEKPETKKPEYVNGTRIKQIKLNAKQILELACEEQELRNDAIESINGKSIGILQFFLDEWCAKQTETQTCVRDPGFKVRIPWDTVSGS